jgi:hypothetical protein
LTPSIYAAHFKVLLSSAGVQPGDTLRLEADGVLPKYKLRVVFAGGSYPFYSIGPDAQRALIGIRLGTLPGHYVFHVDTWSEPPPKWTSAIEEGVDLSSKTFPTESVDFTPAQRQLQQWEAMESAKIHQKLKYLSREQLWEGTFDWPVQGPVEGVFGAHRTENGQVDAEYHKGIDLKAPTGTPVLAANAGIVLMAVHFKAHGRVVLINHGQGVMSIYLHMSRILVRPGQRVMKGREIGLVGSSGLSTSPHVHWGVYVHGVPVDPQQWVETEF